MTKYEMLYILTAESTDEVKEGIIAKFEQLVKDNGGEVESIDKWGVKKLAYAIDYKTEGYYVLMTFQSEPTLIAELDRVAGINENVLRRLITKRNA
ncbi:MAG: 30S ribosomal protein S6 [Clostridia bacterium]|nr:30S ribosomal protein S6 [Clostridia bacterium]MBQ3495322.1 30S ribosomal protein S6 [Clostridia bacterium]MBQ4586582.1 30S ribosomal protein S6 [Clostridia bacterium]MBQ6882983.1 30S ribosomal protein S6 [Clostridia bacterium]MBR2933136.1 30S ribosomal protein S6 [Clostridia bacterium]